MSSDLKFYGDGVKTEKIIIKAIFILRNPIMHNSFDVITRVVMILYLPYGLPTTYDRVLLFSCYKIKNVQQHRILYRCIYSLKINNYCIKS